MKIGKYNITVGDGLYTLWRRLRNVEPIYWLRCHTFTKYHIVDCRNDSYDITPYKYGWYDKDHLLLLASFNLLANFIEKEKPDETIDWESDESHSNAWREMHDLYVWWRTGRRESRLAHEEKYKDLWRDGFLGEKTIHTDGSVSYKSTMTEEERKTIKQCQQDEIELDNIDETNLIRLVKVRRFMWT